jgi:hypothetical protein
MVRLTNRRGIAAGLVVVVLAALAWVFLRPRLGPAAPRAAGSSGRAAGKSQELPRIDLARLDAKQPPSGAGGGDIFQYGAPSVRAVLQPSPPPTAANAGGPGALPTPAPVADVAPTPPPVPVMNVKFIGFAADKKGLKVAVLMTDRKEVLTGRAGDVVANRLKIVSIGLESVDVQDVGSERVRRIPLRAN